MGKILIWELSTLGQLFNFLNFVAAAILSLNCVFDAEYRISQMGQFEDNIGVVSDVYSTVAAFFVMYFSLKTPYEELEITTVAQENLFTVIYLIGLHVAAMSEVVDDPNLIFSKTFELVNELANGTTISTGNVDYYDVHSMGFMARVSTVFLDLIYASKVWCTIAGFVYGFYVIAANPPTPGKEWRKIFTLTAVSRLPSFIAGFLGVYVYFTNMDLSEPFKYSNALYGDVLVDTSMIGISYTALFELISMVLLSIKAWYMLVFWNHYEGALVAISFILLKAVDRRDAMIKDDESFDVMVYAAVVTFAMSISPMVLLARNERFKDVVNYVPAILYRVGIILTIMAGMYLVSSTTVGWFEFEFTPVNLAQGVVDKVHAAEREMDRISDTIMDFAVKLDPCTKKRNLPDSVPWTNAATGDSGNFVAVSNPSQVEKSLAQARKGLFDDGGQDSLCINNVAPEYDWTGANSRCDQLKTKEDTKRKEMVKTIDDDDLQVEKKYTESDFDDEYFVDEKCRNTQCNVMTGVAIGAIGIAAVPFLGVVGTMMNIAGRAAHMLFKVGRKIVKIGPKIRKHRKKLKKLYKTIVNAASATKGAMGFSLAMTALVLPIFIGLVVSLALVMFRRDIYKPPDKEKNKYKAIVQQKIEIGYAATLSTFGPLCIINLMFLLTLIGFPVFLEALLNLLPRGLVRVELEVLVGYNALKQGYLVAFIGTGLLTFSGILFIFNNSLIQFILWFKRQFKYFVRSVRTFGDADGTADADSRLLPKNFAYDSTKLNWFWRFFYRLVDRLMNYNSTYLQPALFVLPNIYLIFDAFINDKEYVDISYKANSQTVRTNDELKETIGQQERTESLKQDTDSTACGLVGQVIDLFVSGVMNQINRGLINFAGVLADAFDEASEFVQQMADLVNFPSIKIDLTGLQWLDDFTQNLFIYAIPIFCTAAVIFAWSSSLVYKPTEYSMLYVGVGCFALSVANIMMHSSISGILTSIAEFEMPYITVMSNVSDDYYITILCSLLNMASCIVIGLNYLLPIPNVPFLRIRRDQVAAGNINELNY